MDGNWLQDVGFKLQDLIAGFMGGLVNAFVFNRVSPVAVVGSIVVGALSANYLGEPAAKYVSAHILDVSEGVASFLIGLGGMGLMQGISGTVSAWKFGGGRSNNDRPSGTN